MNELDHAVLLSDLPEHDLRAGDVGTIVLIHGQGEGCEVEFTALNGDTLAVVTLEASQVRPATLREIARARPLA